MSLFCAEALIVKGLRTWLTCKNAAAAKAFKHCGSCGMKPKYLQRLMAYAARLIFKQSAAGRCNDADEGFSWRKDVRKEDKGGGVRHFHSAWNGRLRGCFCLPAPTLLHKIFERGRHAHDNRRGAVAGRGARRQRQGDAHRRERKGVGSLESRARGRRGGGICRQRRPQQRRWNR